jgi:hypothetical protein
VWLCFRSRLKASLISRDIPMVPKILHQMTEVYPLPGAGFRNTAMALSIPVRCHHHQCFITTFKLVAIKRTIYNWYFDVFWALTAECFFICLHKSFLLLASSPEFLDPGPGHFFVQRCVNRQQPRSQNTRRRWMEDMEVWNHGHLMGFSGIWWDSDWMWYLT